MARGGSGGITALRRHSIGVRTGQVRRALMSLAPSDRSTRTRHPLPQDRRPARQCGHAGGIFFPASLETSIFSQRFSGDFQPPLQL